MIDDNSTVTFTKFPDLSGSVAQLVRVSWGKLKALVRGMQPHWQHKSQMPLVSGMSYGTVLSAKGSLRHDGNVLQLHMLTADIDDARGVDCDEAVARLKAAGVAAIVMSTSSHNVPKGTKPAGPRYRVLLPLKGAHDPHDLAALMDKVNAILGGVVGGESWRLSQAYYFGRPLTGDWFAEVLDGEYLDELAGITPAAQPTAQAGAAAGAGGAGGGAPFSFPTAPVAPATKPTRVKKNNLKSGIVARLVALGLFIKELPDGTVQMRCPFEGSHSTPTVPGDCVYLPPHTMGYSQGHFRCMHDHCKGKTKAEFMGAIRLPLATPANTPTKRVAEFYYVRSSGKWLHVPTGKEWPREAVDTHVPYEQWPIDDAAEAVPPSGWLMKHRAITQEAWLPGEESILDDTLYQDGRTYPHEDARVWNTWHPIPRPVLKGGIWDPTPWVVHVQLLYPDEWAHIIRMLAFKLQNPAQKINHMLILGGASGIGKDMLLQPIARGIGRGNWGETKPGAMLGNFNGFAQTLILRINELESIDGPMRYHFEDKLKVYAAAPPTELALERKGQDPLLIPNVLLVIATTNHRERAIALTGDDRRVFLCWSPVTRAQLPDGYHAQFAGWLAAGGSEAVMEYLLSLDVSDFDPAQPAPMTRAKADVQAYSEDALGLALMDLLDAIGRPQVVCLPQLDVSANTHRIYFDGQALTSPMYRKRAVGWLREAGYTRLANPERADGKWMRGGRRTDFYCLTDDQCMASERVKMQLMLGI